MFSAFPFTIVKAIANSPLGTRLQERMQDYKTKAQIAAPEIESAKERARKSRYANKCETTLEGTVEETTIILKPETLNMMMLLV